MCGILGIFGMNDSDDVRELRQLALQRSHLQRHRGPDWSGIHVEEKVIMVHERLAIVDPESGAQPLLSSDGRLVLAVNGEIYNHHQLRASLRSRYDFQTASDCEVINALYCDDEVDVLLRKLNGIFAFALWDRSKSRVLIARDPMGVCPLYWGHDDDGLLWIASEMKALVGVCQDIEQFPPGHFFISGERGVERYYTKPWREYSATQGGDVSPAELRGALERAVHRQLMSDVPYGVLLSGGLDSSLVASCAARFACRQVEDGDSTETRRPRLHSFSIGLKGSPDLAAAAVAAAAIGTVHHSFSFTIDEGLDALSEVIRHIETYDVTTVRASTPMYLLARRIKAIGVKMVLSGEGADEIFGGYLYFHKAPSSREFHDETVRKLDALHAFDCLRANKAMMAWGVEARVPFLDLEFIDVAMSMDAEAKMVGDRRIEKAVLREAFDGCLPPSILWRQKEQFSDGVGYGWIDGLKAYAASEVSKRDFDRASSRFRINTPRSKEEYLYRSIFSQHFQASACAKTVPSGKSIACSSPAAIAWDASFASGADPSGRAVIGVHNSVRTQVSVA